MSRFLVISTIPLVLVCQGFAQDISFPPVRAPSYLSGFGPVTERIPIYIPGRCPENMLLYPGPGDKSTWRCDCQPGYLYFPDTESCHEAYRQGPCKHGKYVYLTGNDPVPQCVTNPCVNDGYVLFKEQCEELYTTIRSCNNKRLVVDLKDYQLRCESIAMSQNREKIWRIGSPQYSPEFLWTLTAGSYECFGNWSDWSEEPTDFTVTIERWEYLLAQK